MSEATKPTLKVSREGVILIKSFEGFRPRAIHGDDGRWVIGYGHTRSAREGLTVGEQDAELLLQYDLLPVVKALNEQISAELNQHQFDALASFAISIGVERFLTSDVLHRLNEGLAHEAADALVGWPETTPPDAPLRRRAAERALFIADPGSPIHLAELLAAPLPPPAAIEVETPVIQPVFSPPGDARAAAVASLLGETQAEEAAPAPEPAPVAETPAPQPPEPQAAPEPARTQSVAAMHLQRYSPYAAALIGPLPGFPSATPVKAAPATVEPAAEPTVAPEPEPEPAPAATAAPVPTPVRAAIWSPGPVLVTAPSPVTPAPAPWASAAPVAPLVPPAPGPSPFPPMEEALVLTPATEADFQEVIRPIWGDTERTGAPLQETVLFDDEPALSVLRHEIETSEPRRFDWGETGAYMIMGGLGLASCAFSAGAFRLSVEQPSPMGETTLIAWVLALIGAICVGVSSWNLYVRWGKAD